MNCIVLLVYTVYCTVIYWYDMIYTDITPDITNDILIYCTDILIYDILIY